LKVDDMVKLASPEVMIKDFVTVFVLPFTNSRRGKNHPRILERA
jgi:hypothetical protein